MKSLCLLAAHAACGIPDAAPQFLANINTTKRSPPSLIFTIPTCQASATLQRRFKAKGALAVLAETKTLAEC